MNLKLRNTLISAGALTLIGVATAGLVVSLQTKKVVNINEAEDANEANMLSTDAIFDVIKEANALYDSVPAAQKSTTYPDALHNAITDFLKDWTTCRFPEEKDFSLEENHDFDLEHQLEQLIAMINIMKNPTMTATTTLSSEEIRGVVNEAWILYFNTPSNERSGSEVKALYDALSGFEKKWTICDWPDEIDFNAKDKDLETMFKQLKTIIDSMYKQIA